MSSFPRLRRAVARPFGNQFYPSITPERGTQVSFALHALQANTCTPDDIPTSDSLCRRTLRRCQGGVEGSSRSFQISLPGPAGPQSRESRQVVPRRRLTWAGSSDSACGRRLSPPRAAARGGEASAPASLGSPIISAPGETTRRASPGVGDRNAGPEAQENRRARDSDAQQLALPAADRKGSR